MLTTLWPMLTLSVAPIELEGCISPKQLQSQLTLKQTQEDLAKREAQLAAEKSNLEKIRARINTDISNLTKEIERLEVALDIGIGADKERAKRTAALLDTIAALSASKAAPILAQSDEGLVADVLMQLGPRQTAMILPKLTPRKAASLLKAIQQMPKPKGRAKK